MVCVLVSAPLRVTSLSVSAQRSGEAKCHRVKDLIGWQLRFPTPKLTVQTACGRYLSAVWAADDDRPKLDCKFCGTVGPSLSVIVIPSFRPATVGDGLPFEDDLVLRDWKTGLPTVPVSWLDVAKED